MKCLKQGVYLVIEKEGKPRRDLMIYEVFYLNQHNFSSSCHLYKWFSPNERKNCWHNLYFHITKYFPRDQDHKCKFEQNSTWDQNHKCKFEQNHLKPGP